MQPPRGLETLFAALREAKILVGPREVLRVHEVLARADNLDPDGLRSLLAAVLVKSREERQRFDEVFRAFVHAQDAAPQTTPPPVPAPTNLVPIDKPIDISPVKPRFPRRTVLFAAGVLTALVAGALIATLSAPEEPNRELTDKTTPLDAAAASSSMPVSSGLDAGSEHVPTPEELYPDAQDWREDFNDQHDTNSVDVTVEEPTIQKDERIFSKRVPVIQIETAQFWTSMSGLVTGLGLLAILASSGASLVARRRKLLPPKAPAPTRNGPLELPLSAPVPRGLELLDVRSEDALVWGVGKFVTDDVTTNLDIERTVLATAAAGGRPELRFERRGRHRVVCIWIDESARDPSIERFGRELSLALSRVGLDVEIARYWAVPDKLVRADGTVFSPASLEEELAFAIVAIMTDGQALSLRHAGTDRKLGISRLFRMLSRLPRLAFVDFGEGPSRASRVASAYGIVTVRPDEAAAFLALGRKPEIRDAPSRKLSGDATAWAAACALGMRPVDEETAYDVRRCLGLSVSSWAWSDIRRSGRPAGDLIDWPLKKRAELLDWLRRAERGSKDVGVDATSLLGKALTYWKTRLDDEALARAKNDAVTPWLGTPSARTLRIERAFLDLWDRPEESVRTLYSFVGTDAESSVKEKLGDYGPREAEGLPEVIVLPWHFEALPDATRAMLERLGFGGDSWTRGRAPEGDLVERRGRMWMGLGLACGLGVGAIVAGVRSWQTMAFPCVVQYVEGASGWCEEFAGAQGTREILGGNVGSWEQTTAERTQQPVVTFAERWVACEEWTDKRWVIRRCGKEVPPAKLLRVDYPWRSVFMIQGKPNDERIRGLATALLDRHVADVVVTSESPLESPDVDQWFPRFREPRDRLVVLRSREMGQPPAVVQGDERGQLFDVELPRKARVIGLPDKPKQVWWNAQGDRAIALSVRERVFEIDAVGKGIEREIVPPPRDLPPSLRPTSGEAGVTLSNLLGEHEWMAWSPDGKSVVFPSDRGLAEIASFGGANNRRWISWPGGYFDKPVVWNWDGSRFAAISNRLLVAAWSTTGASPISQFQLPTSVHPSCLAWSVNGTEILVGTESGMEMLISPDTRISLPITNHAVSHIVGPVASKYLVVSSSAGRMFLVSSNQVAQGAPAFELVRQMDAFSGSIRPDGRMIATIHQTGKIRVTSTEGIVVNEFECDTKEAPVWSPDGRRLLAICGDKLVDAPAVPAMFSLRTVDGKCVSRDELMKIFGASTQEADLMVELCEAGRKP